MCTPVKTVYLIYYNISIIFCFFKYSSGRPLCGPFMLQWANLLVSHKSRYFFFHPVWAVNLRSECALHCSFFGIQRCPNRHSNHQNGASVPSFPKLGVFDILVKIPLRKMRGLVIAGWPGRIRCSSILQGYRYTDWSVMIWRFFLDPKLGTL